MQLSQKLYPQRNLPETILQFGGGVFLRGFFQDFLDRGIEAGHIGGRAVIVRRNHDRRSAAFVAQGGLYTLWLRGKAGGQTFEKFRRLAGASRVLAADDESEQVRTLARSPHLEVIISNATEVGYATTAEDVPSASPPPSFPAKLTALLHDRWKAGAPGLIVIPCELLERNGERLRHAVLDLAETWNLAADFSGWVTKEITFCSTLVDRIVTGPPSSDIADQAFARLGYRDDLLITAEPYGLFAIEDQGRARERFPLDRASPEVVYVPDATPYWRRKLRLLNSPHTLLAAQGLLRGYTTVRQALGDPEVRRYLETTIFEEIVPTLGGDRTENETYARQVLERFENPFVEHRLLNICFHCSTKVGVRLFPIIQDFKRDSGRMPSGIVRGIGGILRLFQDRARFPFEDKNAERIAECWNQGLPGLAKKVLSDPTLWGGNGADPSLIDALNAVLKMEQSPKTA